MADIVSPYSNTGGEMILPWRIELFGGLRALHGDTVISKFQTQKTGAVLGYVALCLGKTVSREKLSETLWVTGQPLALRNRLNQAISSLRRQLESPGSGLGRVFISDHYTLGLEPSSVTTDVSEFLDAAKHAEKAESSEHRIRFWEQAAGLYRGELLEGYSDAWIEPERKRLAWQFAEILRLLVNELSTRGHHAQAAAYATRLVDLTPEDEQAHINLMSLLIASNRHQAAHRQFEALTQILNEKGLEPSELAKNLALEAGLGPVQISIGSARKSLGPEAMPKVSQVEPKKNRIPTPFNKLVGREEESEAIIRLISQEGARIVTIIGIGGSGKSRLGIELGHRLLERFDGNVYFVPFVHDLTRANLVEQIGSVVCSDVLTDNRNMDVLQSRLAEVGFSLLIIDTAENLSDNDSTLLVELLEATPGLRLLSTSRRPLHLPGEVQFPLGPLPVPLDTELSVEEIAKNPSVSLFVQRAQALKPDFQVTERTGSAIAKLCQRLEGLPLSLELAAGWTRLLTPSQMLESLSKRLDFLESRRRDISVRHRTIRAVLDSTVGSLTNDLKETFIRLSLFRGGFDHAAASRVCPDSNMKSAIDELLEACLLQSSTSEGESPRFSMLETLQDYGREHASANLVEETGWLHAEHFLDLVEQNLVTGTFATHDDWFSAIARDFSNIVQALSWFLEHDRYDEAARLASSLEDYWENTGSLREGLRWFIEILDGMKEGSPLYDRSLGCAAKFSWFTGDRPMARRLIQRASHSRTIKPDKSIMPLLFVLQLDEHHTGSIDEAQRMAEEGLRFAQEIEDVSAESRWNLRLGNLAIDRCHWEEAKIHYERCLQLGRSAGDTNRVAGALINLGNLAIHTDQLELARISTLEGIEHAKVANNKDAMGHAYANLARIECLSGQAAKALSWILDALRINAENKNVVGEILTAAAEAAAKLGEAEVAGRLLGHTATFHELPNVAGHEGELIQSITADGEKLIGPARFGAFIQAGRLMSLKEVEQLVTTLSSIRPDV